MFLSWPQYQSIHHLRKPANCSLFSLLFSIIFLQNFFVATHSNTFVATHSLSVFDKLRKGRARRKGRMLKYLRRFKKNSFFFFLVCKWTKIGCRNWSWHGSNLALTPYLSNLSSILDETRFKLTTFWSWVEFATQKTDEN